MDYVLYVIYVGIFAVCCLIAFLAYCSWRDKCDQDKLLDSINDSLKQKEIEDDGYPISEDLNETLDETQEDMSPFSSPPHTYNGYNYYDAVTEEKSKKKNKKKSKKSKGKKKK